MMQPMYINTKLDSSVRCKETIDVNNQGVVFIDIGSDGSIIGVEILAEKYEIEIDGQKINLKS